MRAPFLSLLIAYFRLPFATSFEPCGFRKIDTEHIADGSDVPLIGKWPWLAFLEDSDGKQFCGGTLLTPRVVVTAAHCQTPTKVLFGRHYRKQRVEGEQEAEVERVIRHPKFFSLKDSHNLTERMEADLALLILKQDIELNRYAQPICLPAAEEALPAECMIAGWGRFLPGEEYRRQRPYILQEAKVTVGTACQNDGISLPESILCTQGSGVSTCKGDSGGPMICRRSPAEPWTLYGVVSYGICGQKTVFMKVAHFASWINEHFNETGPVQVEKGFIGSSDIIGILFVVGIIACLIVAVGVFLHRQRHGKDEKMSVEESKWQNVSASTSKWRKAAARAVSRRADTFEMTGECKQSAAQGDKTNRKRKPEPVASVMNRLRRERVQSYKSYATLSLFENVKPMSIKDLFVELEFRTPDDAVVDKYQNIVGQFFHHGENAQRKLMVVKAQPGQGKTTLVKKLCFDWSRAIDGDVDESNSYIAHIDLLLVCSLREVRENVKSVLEICVPDEAERTALLSWLETNSTRFLVVLDGFDELQPSTLCTELYSLFFNAAPTFVPPFPIIVTSRPAALRDARLFFSAEIRGLVGAEVSKFVVKHCSNKASREKVLRYLEENATLKENLFRCPLLLSMLCALVEVNITGSEDELPKTQTQLYTQICNWLRVKKSEKYGSGFVEAQLWDDEVFRSLARFAFEKTVCDDSRLIFDKDDLENAPFNIDVDQATRIGFLTSDSAPLQQRARFSINKPSISLSFLHRTVQEFCAAFYASRNADRFAESVKQMQFKRFLSHEFLIFLSGLIDETSKAFDVLKHCLHAKGELSMEEYNKSLLTLKQRRTKFPSAICTDKLSTVGDLEEYFERLYTQIPNEGESEAIRDALLASMFSPYESAWQSAWLLNMLFSTATKFLLPRGFEASSIGFHSVDGLLFRIVVLSKPFSAVFVSQTAGEEADQRRFSFDELPKEAPSFYFTGEANAFLSLLGPAAFRLRVTEMCRLRFCTKTKIDESRIVRTPYANGVLEISNCGLDLVLEERLDGLQWMNVRETLLGDDLEWLHFRSRWDPFSKSIERTDATCDLQASIRAENRIWKIGILQLSSLDFDELRRSIAIGDHLSEIFDSIETETIYLIGCRISSVGFSLLLSRGAAKSIKALVLTTCSPSSGASIFDEVAKIVVTLPNLEQLEFNACEFPADGDTKIDVFCEILEGCGSGLRRLLFRHCENLTENETARFKVLELDKRLPELEFIDVDDERVYTT